MAFVQLAKFDGTPQNSRDTEGDKLLINTNRIAEVSVVEKISEHTGEPEFKWLRVTFFDDKSETVSPLDANENPMKPTEARGHGDSTLLEWFQTAARRG